MSDASTPEEKSEAGSGGATPQTPAEPSTTPMTGKEKYLEKMGVPAEAQGDEPERELWKGAFSPKAIYGEWILVGALMIALVVLLFMYVTQVQSYWYILAGFVGLVVVLELFRLVYKRLNHRFRLTNQRFIHETGIIRRITDRIEVIDVNDVGFEQGIVERFFGVGTITIHSTDQSHPELKMHGIENVEDVAHKIDDARRKERIRRGVQVINT